MLLRHIGCERGLPFLLLVPTVRIRGFLSVLRLKLLLRHFPLRQQRGAIITCNASRLVPDASSPPLKVVYLSGARLYPFFSYLPIIALYY